MQAWSETALDYLNYNEDHQFLYLNPGKDVKGRFPAAPSVSVIGTRFDPLPFEGDFSHVALTEWVNITQFEAVTEMSLDNAHALQKSGMVVVVLLYKGEDYKTSEGFKASFEFKAKQLRKDQQFLFATIDVSTSENDLYITNTFPLLAPKVATPPR